MGDKTELIEQRSEKLEEIRQLGHDPYPHKYELSHTVAELVHDCLLYTSDAADE